MSHYLIGLALCLSLAAPLKGRQTDSSNLTLVAELSESEPLSRVLQVVPLPDGGTLLLDRYRAGVLQYDQQGRFQREIGRKGDGPGELRQPFRIGLLGSAMWVADAGDRTFEQYDLQSGQHVETLSARETWSLGRTPGVQIALLSMTPEGGALVATQLSEAVDVDLFLLSQAQADPSLIARLDGEGKYVALPVEGGAVRLRSPYSAHQRLAVDPWTAELHLLENAPSGIRYQRLAPSGEVISTTRLEWTSRPLPQQQVERWLDRQRDLLTTLVAAGEYDSGRGARAALAKALDAPAHFPSIYNRGTGVLEEGLVPDVAGKGVWLLNGSAMVDGWTWTLVTELGTEATVTLRPNQWLLAAMGSLLWIQSVDGLDVPHVAVYRMELSPDLPERP